MSFSLFSREFNANMFTAVENQFIVKYLPQANGDAVKVYLYGLYLCSSKEDFDGETCAKLLKISYDELIAIYQFWEECDLVHVLSQKPLLVEYLPVNTAVGKPKPIRPEKYAQFNRELLRILQKAGKDFKPYEMQRILEFLENNPMEQQAFLLVAEYCAKKDGEKLSAAHILNKAKKLCSEYKYTYDLVERDLADFNTQEREMATIFSLLGIYRKPQDNDYEYLNRWKKEAEIGAVYESAKALKKGTLSSLDSMMGELFKRNIRTAGEAKEYFMHRERYANVVFAVARKLSVKIQNPGAYIEEYAEKWLERGYDEESLSAIAQLSFRLGYGFPEMDSLLDGLYREGIIEKKDVKAYCAERDGQLRLLQSVQNVCGVVKKTLSSLDMIAVWKSWNLSDALILEAAKRSASAGAPLPYMNKLLSEWKRAGVTSPEEAEKTAFQKTAFKNEAAVAADKKSDREHYYAVLRQNALQKAEQSKERAQRDEEFRRVDSALKKGEIELAKAEVYAPETLSEIQNRMAVLQKERAAALKRLGLSEEAFLPKYHCEKCSDTGFLPDGRMCDCYQP